MKNIIISPVIAIALVITPFAHVSADTESDAREVLSQQLSALQLYLVRTFNLQDYSPLQHDRMREIIAGGSRWLQKSQETNGHFAYEYAPYEGVYRNDDNIVRQAGALYELGEVARRDPGDTLDNSETIERAIIYFEGLTKDAEGGSFSCIATTEESVLCKLGATSLALAGILGYLEQSPDRIDAHKTLVESYVSYILASKKEGAGFSNEYRVGVGFRDAESSFSNGEALMALVRYYQYNPREDVKEVIDTSFQYLKDTEFDTPLYLWIMAALKDMHELWPNTEYTEYGEAFTNWRLAQLLRVHGTNKNYCASTEGLVSAYSLLEDSLSASRLLELRYEIDFWNSKNSILQLTSADQFRVVLVDGALNMERMVEPEIALGGFLTSDDVLTQRIDFTQHCISAYLQTLVDVDGQSISNDKR